ncbi:tumor necrosis factor alpha-induced protein 2-like [Scomber japonicus]|uniref:tumor necrosis factor alpha-induced protein 2-like n=1 Tax=Scomber japonicus TaxID=13676 RepID=UPI0023055703|nr:tumor necrosis factor alpha-induced protein 2-like [Scomber japonicus]
MRTRSDSTDSAGFSHSPPLDANGRPGPGKGLKKKFQKLFGGSKTQANSPAISPTNGQHSPVEEEPQNVISTFEQCLEDRRLCEASQRLIEREERLFGEITDAEAVKHQEEEIKRLSADRKVLEDLITQILKQSLNTEVNIEALTSAVKAICQEEEQDQLWKQRGGTSPDWRPSEWKKLHDSTLSSLVTDYMDNPTTSSPPADNVVNRSSLQVDVCGMGRQLKQDLQWVVDVVKTCYPPEMHICNTYARWYHQFFSARLRKIAEFGLGDKDCTFLLRWVNEFYPEILQKLAGEIDHEALGKLLPQDLLEPLEEQYLTKQQSELTTFIGRVLEEAREKWDKGENPEREDGCFVSPVSYDIIQLINGIVSAAIKIVLDQRKAQNLTRPLKNLLERFKTFQDDIMKQRKPNSKPFIKANLGCVKQFRDVLVTRRHLFPEDVRESCLSILNDMKQSAHTYLLSPVHEILKPHYRKLGISDWLNKPAWFDNLLHTIEQEIGELQGSTEACHQELIGQLHQEVIVEYVRRLLKGEVKLKNKEREEKAYKTVKDNAESLHSLFMRQGSKEDWLKEILNKIAEVLKLQDLPAIQMEVVSLAAYCPDLSGKHVSALLKLRTNLTKADRKTVKDTLSDTLRETHTLNAQRTFFSRVQVK